VVAFNAGNIRSERESRMNGYNEKRNKHLTSDDRQEIQGCLDRGMSFKAIGKRIKKAATTVSREVFNGKCPYELFVAMYGEETASILGICEIPPHEVVQSPKLLKMLKKNPPDKPITDNNDRNKGDKG